MWKVVQFLSHQSPPPTTTLNIIISTTKLQTPCQLLGISAHKLHHPRLGIHPSLLNLPQLLLIHRLHSLSNPLHIQRLHTPLGILIFILHPPLLIRQSPLLLLPDQSLLFLDHFLLRLLHLKFELSFFLFRLPRFGSTVDFIGGDEGGCPLLGAEFPGAFGGVAAGELEGGGAGGGEDVAV